MHRIIKMLKNTVLASLLLTSAMLLLGGIMSPQAHAAGYCPGIANASCRVVAVSSVPCSNLSSCPLIQNYVDPLVTFLTAVVGVAVVISIIIGGIQYTSSAGDPSKAGAAKDRIRNAIIALVVYILLFGLLNFLIPGGLGGG